MEGVGRIGQWDVSVGTGASYGYAQCWACVDCKGRRGVLLVM